MKIIQTMCACCGQDIEGNPRDGWRDRGAGRACLPFRAPDGEIVRPAGGMHSPRLTPRRMLRRGADIEVGCTVRGRPSYRWVHGWIVVNPSTGRYCAPMRYLEALQHAHDMLQRVEACSP